MKTTMSYFKGSFLFAGIALLAGFLLGYVQQGLAVGLSFLMTTVLLGVLETSVSLDNAVVNAKKLATMNEVSVKWFLSWGILIAVFGMRVLFPILIVCMAAWVNPLEALNLALFNPTEYQHHIESAHIEIMGFGAAFLLMVFLEFFFNSEKDEHWIPGLEHFAAFVGKFPHIQLILAMPLILLASATIPTENKEFLVSAIGGMLSWYAVHGLKELLEGNDSPVASAVSGLSRLMIGSLIYLEVLDASFSFDGVLAALALTNNFIVIALGLGIGAFFVRSMTVYMVERGTLGSLPVLEHGAFWGIGWLVAAMVAECYGIHFGEIVTAGVAALFIAAAAVHSLWINKRNAQSK